MPGAVALLVPALHLGAAKVLIAGTPEHRLVGALTPEVPQRLREVEHRPRVTGIALEGPLEHLDVPLPATGARAADRMDLDPQPVEPRARLLLLGGDVFVRRPDEAPRQVAPDDA